MSKKVQKRFIYQEPKQQSDGDNSLFGMFGKLPEIGDVFSFSSNKGDEVEILTESDPLTKAEERVRLANEILANNTKARARLAMTEIIR